MSHASYSCPCLFSSPARALHHLHRQQEAAEAERQRDVQAAREELWQASEPILEQRKAAAIGGKAMAR